MDLYPLKFHPRLVEKIWGGRKLRTVLGKALPEGRMIGESWELYDFPPGVVEDSRHWVSAVVRNGPLAGRTLHELMQGDRRRLLGEVEAVGEQGQFPLLVKFLDAREDLSVQVHPPQAYADAHPGAHLKTEAWYVLEHDPGARLLKGLAPGVTREAFERAIGDQTVESLLGSIPARVRDCHFLPSGTVHALGAGMLVAEVQTPSDTTFRVYDFGRLENGRPRKLHVQEAMQCIDFEGTGADAQAGAGEGGKDGRTVRHVSCSFFTIDEVQRKGGETGPWSGGRAAVWVMVEGEVELAVGSLPEPERVVKGETVLMPAEMPAVTVRVVRDARWLEVGLPGAE